MLSLALIIIVAFFMVANIPPAMSGAGAMPHPALNSPAAPVWGFQGAYMNYTVTMTNNTDNITHSINGYEQFNIVSIGPNGNFTVDVSTNLTSGNFIFGAQQSPFNGTFNTPPGNFPVLNATDMYSLNTGKLPPSIFPPNMTVKTGVTVTVPAGKYVADEISGNNILGSNSSLKFFVDKTSGVLVYMHLNASVVVRVQPQQVSEYMNYSMSLSSTNIPMATGSNGFLAGDVSPGGAKVMVDGTPVPVFNGTFNTSLAPGEYYITAVMNGYRENITTVSITQGKNTHISITMLRLKNSFTISGDVTLSPVPSQKLYVISVFVGGSPAYVNPVTDQYSINVPSGTYRISAFYPGYTPQVSTVSITSSKTINFTLQKQPSPTSVMKNNDTSVTGYNVTISKIINGKGLIAVNFTASKNGSISVTLPYKDMKNLTPLQVLNSSVYINGVKDKNFTIAFSSNFTVVLTVYNIPAGDPMLYWLYSPSALIPSTSHPAKIPLLDYAIIGGVVVATAIIGIVAVERKKK